MKQIKRIIFKDKDNANNMVAKLAFKYHWLLRELIRADPENQISYEKVYSVDGEHTEIAYVEDIFSECFYLTVIGEIIDPVCEIIKESIVFWQTEEVFNEWKKAVTDTDQILSILRIGVAAPQVYDKDFAICFNEGLSSEDASIREATLAAIGYRDWKEYDSMLEKVSAQDQDERCRDRAKIMLEIRKRERS